MSYVLIVNGRMESEVATLELAREMAEDAALRGAPCKIAQVVAECAPFPTPTWTEVAP